MRILVIEDKQKHRDSAYETLAGHDVTILSTFDAAIEAMEEVPDAGKVQALLAAAGFPTRPENDGSEEAKARFNAYWDAKQDAEKKSVPPFPYDVVLVDMMMPLARNTALGRDYVRNWAEEVPYGFILVLRAAMRGAKYVALVTDTNHHQGAMSAALDHLGSAYYQPMAPNFTINGAKCMFVHSPFVEDQALGAKCYNCVGGTACGYCRTPLNSQGKCPRANENAGHSKPCFVCNGAGVHDTTVHERKDWGQVLRDLLS